MELGAAPANGKGKKKKAPAASELDEDDIEAKYNLAGYDDEGEDELPAALGNMDSLMYYDDNAQDPNLQVPVPALFATLGRGDKTLDGRAAATTVLWCSMQEGVLGVDATCVFISSRLFGPCSTLYD